MARRMRIEDALTLTVPSQPSLWPSGDRVVYLIVGDVESDIRESRISVSSPVARALIGKSEGDVVEVQAPSGVREYEVVSVRYI